MGTGISNTGEVKTNECSEITLQARLSLTYWWKSHLSTHHSGIDVGKAVITDCTPLVVVTNFHSAFV